MQYSADAAGETETRPGGVEGKCWKVAVVAQIPRIDGPLLVGEGPCWCIDGLTSFAAVVPEVSLSVAEEPVAPLKVRKLSVRQIDNLFPRSALGGM